MFPGCFANGLPASEGAALAAEQQPLAASALKEKLTAAPVWQTIPSWAVIGTEDRVIPPATQRSMAERAGATITEVAASHVSMVSHPSVTIDAILAAVAATDA